MLKDRESGKQSERKRSRAHAAIADSDDDDNVSVFDRIRGKGAPKSVKAARRDRQANTQSIADLHDTDNPGYLMKASTLIEHIFIRAFPQHRQNQIRTATEQEVRARPEVLWDARRRFLPKFSTEQDEHNIHIIICRDNDHDADAAFAQRLQDSIIEKDSIIYNKRQLQM